MIIQTEFDFTATVHRHENNAESETILFEQIERLGNNNRIIYKALMRGEHLTGTIIQQKYKMSEYRRRIADLRETGIEISEKRLKGGSKEWWIEDSVRRSFRFTNENVNSKPTKNQ